MRRLLGRLFHIYPGEEKQALLFALLGFFWALGVGCGLKFADAFFLIHVGAASLPIAYTCAACGNIAIAALMLYSFHTFRLSHLFLAAIAIGCFFYLLAYFCLSYQIGTATQWLWFALKIFGWLFFTVVVTCFWTFIDQYYHLQDAKRLYSFFSSFIFLGLISTGMLMRLSLIDTRHLLLLIVFILAITFFWIRLICKKLIVVPDDNESESGIPEMAFSWRHLLKSIVTSPFALLLMSGNLLIQVLAVLTEYNYLSDFDRYFDVAKPLMATSHEEKASLTLFLGQSIAAVSISNLLFGLFIYSRLVRRFGVSSLAICTPMVLFFTFSGWLFSHSLLFPLMGFFVVEGLLYVVDDCNFTLLLNAMPSQLKYKLRIAIESFFEPIGMLTSALLISFVPIDSKLIGLALSLLALSVAFALRSHYFKGIYRNLADHAIFFQKRASDWWKGWSKREKKNAELRLLAILRGNDETACLLACEGLLASDDPVLLHKMLPLLDRLSLPAKQQFVAFIDKSAFRADSRVIDLLQRWLPEDKAIYFYFATLGIMHLEMALESLHSNDLTLRGAAILALKKSWVHQSPTAVAMHQTMAAKELEKLLASSQESEVCMGLAILSSDSSSLDIETLLPFLSHSSKAIAQATARALAKAIDPSRRRYAPLLIAQLTTSTDSEYRLSCLKALEKVMDSTLIKELIQATIHFRPRERRKAEQLIAKMGLRTVPFLLSIVKETSLHDRCRLLAGRILGQLALTQLQANLCEIISLDIERAYFYFYHHHTIQGHYPNIDLKLLQELLLTDYQSIIDFIIQLLGIAGSLEDGELLSRSLRSHNPKVRSQAIETLEKSCDSKIYRQLYPLIADLPLEEKIKAYQKGGAQRTLSLTELLNKMDQSPLLADQILSTAMQYRLQLPHWKGSLKQKMHSSEEIFHRFAYELLES